MSWEHSGSRGGGGSWEGSSGSSFKKHISTKSGNVEELVLWSDSCSGRNPSIKMTLMLKLILQNYPTVKKITLMFPIPRHLFLLKNYSTFGNSANQVLGPIWCGKKTGMFAKKTSCFQYFWNFEKSIVRLHSLIIQEGGQVWRMVQVSWGSIHTNPHQLIDNWCTRR